jgi:hypothetical protein
MINAEDLVGTWQLQSWTTGYSDRDELSYPFGEDPQGLLIYSKGGWMSAAISRSDRPRLPADSSPRTTTPELQAQAYTSYFHYAGRYEVREGHIIHFVTLSLNPDFPGTEQLRHVELDGQTLVLSGKDQVGDVTRFHSLVWHRTEPAEQHPVIEGN